MLGGDEVQGEDVAGPEHDVRERLGLLSGELISFFERAVLDALVERLDGIRLVRRRSMDFIVEVETADLVQFDIRLSDGFLGRVYRALDVPEEPLPALVSLAEDLLGDAAHYELIARAVLRFSAVFALLHEYCHIAAGHLHALEEPAGFGQRGGPRLRHNEVTPPDQERAFRLPAPGIAAFDIMKVFEFEADAAAYETLTDFLFEIFYESDDILEVVRQDILEDNLTGDERSALNLLAFMSCSLSVSLTHIQRVSERSASDYPEPLSRMMSLCLVSIRRGLAGDWIQDGIHQSLTLSKEHEALLRDSIVPMMSQALDVCRTCCANAGLPLDGDDAKHTVGFRRGYARDVASLAQGRVDDLITDAGKEIGRIQVVRAGLLDSMDRLRQTSWWER